MQELAILVAVLFIVGGTWLFVEVAEDVNEGTTQAIDTALLLAFRTPGDLAQPIGPPWVEEGVLSLTALGSSVVLGLLTLAVAGYLLLDRQYNLALLVIIAVAGAFIFNALLKIGFNRPRPDIVPQLTSARFASFPSGHSMTAAATYLTLGALLARSQPRRQLKLYFMGLAIVVTLLVGITRVYLGVHWPTDVLAGWTAGTLWALLCWLAADRLGQRRIAQRRDDELKT